ncbi:sprouty-related, EVH1 domain-containing protein 3 isoform X5 [Leopardus geoffroyi]|uniref:sprouty-related, EVH1 domain-containing protein 3 isoform X5 n=2 Tax=Felinae TaxID=338152 RepID=UPI001E260436|nr:sprouty-related, EVH1 domain-containing protein 3 isoform X5 [Leopardus geoffroyi]
MGSKKIHMRRHPAVRGNDGWGCGNVLRDEKETGLIGEEQGGGREVENWGCGGQDGNDGERDEGGCGEKRWIRRRYMVQVRAVVMARDDSSGGWLPVGGGGLSQTTLECTLRPGLVYNKVNPIFHHWSLGDCKFGLTFQSPAEADEFQKSLLAALAALGRGSLTPSSSSSSSSPSQDTAETPCPLTSYPPLLPFTGIPEPSEPLAGVGGPGWGGRGYEDYRRAGPPAPLALSTCVVRFAKTGALRGAALGPPTALPAPLAEAAPPAPPARPPPGPGPAPAPAKASPEAEEAARCVHCRALFRRRADGRGGRCAEAPDPGRLLVRRLSCLWCAESLLYHCLSDAEGDFSDPCACEPGHPRPAARWAALAALSLAVPCLCCYAPLRACHWVAARCGCAGCGGRHEEAAR